MVRPGEERSRPDPRRRCCRGGSLFWIRRHPLAAFLTNGLAVYTLIALGYPSDFYQWTNLVALFAMASRVETRQAIAALALGWVGVISYFLRFPEEGGLILGGAVVAIWTAGWFAGRAQFARVREAEVDQGARHFEGRAGGSAGHGPSWRPNADASPVTSTTSSVMP